MIDMIRARIIPSLLIKGSGLYKTVRFKDPVYVGDPINAVRIFNVKEVDELIILDIDAIQRTAGPNFDMISSIVSEAFVPLCYGGGVTQLDEIENLFRIGVEKVAINSAATGNMDLVSKAARIFGSQSIVVGIDVRKSLFGRYERYLNSARIKAKETAVEAARRAESAGAGELLLNSVDCDGTMQGFDISLVQEVAAAVRIPVIACGGGGSVSDMVRVIRDGHAASASAGSLFVFHGKHRAVLITYPDQETISQAFEELN